MKKNNNNSLVTKKQVKQMIKTNTAKEWNKKYILTNSGVPGSSTSVDATGTIVSLTTVAQGTTNQTRIGNFARCKKIWGNVSAYADSTDVQNTMRVIFFRWTDAATPTASDVLVSATAYHTCYYNLNNIENGKLQILDDFRMGINYNGTGPKTLHYERKTDFPLQWNSTGSAAPITNAVYVYFVSDSSVATHPYVQSSFAVLIDNE
jgi:hypothetical protein